MMARRGASLVEVILITVVILVVILVVTTLFSKSMRAVRVSESRTYANTLAESALETARSKGFGGLALGDSDWPDQTFDSVIFHTHLTVGVSPQVDGKLLKTVRATVTWQWGALNQQIQREVWICGVKS